LVRLRFALGVAAALLGACGAGSGDTTLQIVHDVCEPTALIAPADASGDEIASIDGAIDMWARQGFDRLVRGDGESTTQAIEIVFEEASEVFHGLYDDEHGVVYINRTLADDHERTVTVAHELGHAFGLWHIEDRSSVMLPGNLDIEPNAGDADALRGLWGPCSE
jgi:hypothetical protein